MTKSDFQDRVGAKKAAHRAGEMQSIMSRPSKNGAVVHVDLKHSRSLSVGKELPKAAAAGPKCMAWILAPLALAWADRIDEAPTRLPIAGSGALEQSSSSSPSLNLEIHQTHESTGRRSILSPCRPSASTSGSPHTSHAVAAAAPIAYTPGTDSTTALLQLWRAPLPLRRLHRRRLPTRHGPDRSRHPAADDTTPTGPVRHYHAAQREGPGRDPVGHRVRRHLGTPIGLRVLNEDQRPKDYGNATIDPYPRPSHADWTYLEKYGVKASSGGGRSSAFIPAETAQRLETGVDRAGLPRPKLTTKTNYSGGIQGGITNGAPIYFRVGFKPPATVGQEQTTATDDSTREGLLAAKGRHDPCVVPRPVPIVEAMAALVVMDTVLAQQSRSLARSLLPPLNAAKDAGENGKAA